MNSGSPKFNEWLETAPTWKKFYNYLNDDSVFHSFVDYYNDDLKKWNSVISKDSSLKTNCFLHIDWSSATDGYVREIHRDTDKRIWNFLIFFNDKDWEGGDFVIHSSDSMTRLDQSYGTKTHYLYMKQLRQRKTKEYFSYQRLIHIIQYLNNLIQNHQESLSMVLIHIEMVMYLEKETNK